MKGEKKTPDWAGMPHELIEKIIGHAIDADLRYEDGLVFKLHRAGCYARVCRGWKAAVFGSTRRFKQEYTPYLSLDPCSHYDGTIDPELLIKEGFLSLIRRLDLYDTYPLPRGIGKFAHGSSIERFEVVSLNQQSADDGHGLISLLYLSKKAQSFEIGGEVENQNDVELLWKLLRAMVHCNKRPKRIKCEIMFTCQPDWSFVDANAGNLKGRIEKLDLSTCQFRDPDDSDDEETEVPLPTIEAPDWSALAHVIEHVKINPTIIKLVTTMKAESLKIVEEPTFEYDDERKFIAFDQSKNMRFRHGSHEAKHSMGCHSLDALWRS